MACEQLYTIRSVKGSETVRTRDPVDAIQRGIKHELRLMPAWDTTVEDAQGETVATVRAGADAGLVVELADGTEVNLSEAEEHEARALLRAAMEVA